MAKKSTAPARIGFYCQLPKSTVREIKLQAKAKRLHEWQIIANHFAAEASYRKVTAGKGRK